MCITAPARIVEVGDGRAVVDLEGVRRLASTLVVPDVAVGDWVIVGAGTILRRVDAREALDIAKTISSAAAAGNVRAAPAGGDR